MHRYGELEVVFESSDKPQFVPVPSIQKARRIMKDFSPDDFLLWAVGGDPIAVMIVCVIASEMSPLTSDGNVTKKKVTEIDVKDGMPVALEMRKVKNDEYQR